MLGENVQRDGVPRRHINKVINVVAFVDWNSQIHLSGLNAKCAPVETARSVLARTAKRLATCLVSADPTARFSVGLRLYHGWHRGFEPSPNKKAIKTVLAETDFAGLSPRPQVRFLESVEFGDRLLAASTQRLHPKLGIHLPNTLRSSDGVDAEKMVDTALAADVLYTAFTEPGDWICVIAEDDDLIPPLFTAEVFLQPLGARVLLVHARQRSAKFLRLDLLTVRQT